MDYDPVHDEIIVTNPQAGAILVFRGDASGNESPIRIIQGPKTQLFFPHTVSVDPKNNEILVGDPGKRSVLVFPREASGDVSPVRVLTPKTGFWIVGTAVDPVRNLLVVALRLRVGGQGALYVYNRTDTGDVNPRAVITGPKTGILSPWQIEIHDGKIYAALANNVYRALYEGINQRQGIGKDVEILSPWRSDVLGFIGVWDVTDGGDIAPRAIIKGPVSEMVHPGGVALNVRDGEIYSSDSVRNAVYTYLVPEFFADKKR
jgi:DNA-binding beta-propeller fold protein YncE